MKNHKGFTLVELLVVIAIIGILASVVLVSLNSARSKARDARVISDFRQLSLALENYYDATGAYPTGKNGEGLDKLVPDYMSSKPTPPSNPSGSYRYHSDTCTPANQRYVLRWTMENASHSALNNDIDGTQCTKPCDDSPNAWYCVGVL